MVSGGDRGDVSVLCEEGRILEVVSNVLRPYVGVESERASESCAVDQFNDWGRDVTYFSPFWGGTARK